MRSSEAHVDEVQSWITQFRKGLVELSILAVLRQGEAYGYQIVERLAAAPGLEITESTVYPALARMTRDKFLLVRTAASPAGPPRRYYRLSESGRARVTEMIRDWQTIQQSTNRLIEGEL